MINVFNTPDWDYSQIGNDNALQLFKANISTKAAKKSKSKSTNSDKNIRMKKIKINTKGKSISVFKNKSESGNSKTKTVDTSCSLNSNNTKPNSKKNINKKNNLNTSISQKLRKKESIECNIVRDTEKSPFNKHVAEKLTKQKTRRLQKKNKLHKSNVMVCKNVNNDLSYNKKRVKLKEIVHSSIDTKIDNSTAHGSRKAKLINLLSQQLITKKTNSLSLKEKMIEKLKASRFRYLNEQIYNSEGKDAQKYFKNDPDAFYAYHEGYKQQISKWPLNPVDVIIKSIRKMPTDFLIADFGCGEAKLAQSVSQKVFSYDLVAVNDYVIACDMSKVPLGNETVNVVVFCLSLMGTNIREYLFEANRVLRNGGILKIAEVESRFDTVDVFIDGVKRFGFTTIWKDLSHNLFYFLDFKKISKCKPLSKLPTIGLHPCLYKKR